MFDKLEDLIVRLEEILRDLSEPEVANDSKRFQKLMKEQAEITPIVETYKAYKQAKQDEEDSLLLLDEESDCLDQRESPLFLQHPSHLNL